MKYIFKLTIILITFTLVSYDQRYLLNKQFIKPEQATLATRKPGPPLSRSALDRLAENITIEIVTPSYLSQGGITPLGSGVIIGRNRDTYYVLTARHLFDYQDYGYRIIIRSKRPGEDLEVVLLDILYFYPDADLAVVAFASRRQYTVAKIGEPSELKKNSQVYIGGWPGVDNRDGFQFTPAKVTNPRAKDGDSLAYEPTEAGEDVYPGMSGGPVLNEEGHLMGIHVGLMELDGDGEGVLVSAFLREIREIREDVDKALVRVTPDVVSPPPRGKGDVGLRRQRAAERRKREEAERRQREKMVEERRKREEAERRSQELEAEREKELQEAERRAIEEREAERRQPEQLEAERRKHEEAEWRKLLLELEAERARLWRAREELQALQAQLDLPSARGVDYRKLRDLLAAGRWKEADRETNRVILRASRSESLQVRTNLVENFSCQDLRTIDKLWVKYSNGNFGLSVQKQIYQSLGGTKKYDHQVWRKFGDKVGWRKWGLWLDYNGLTFSKEHYRGHLPSVAGLASGLKRVDWWFAWWTPLHDTLDTFGTTLVVDWVDHCVEGARLSSLGDL